jgi:ubiquinone/menaquinone biosynthesis C-methylase UbiE
MSQASDANEKTASSVVAGKSLVGSSASPQAQPQGTPAAAISLKDASLAAAWDVAAEAIEQDLMRPVRYGMCMRYLIPNLKSDARILEVGCGEGTGLALLQQIGFKNLAGVEVSSERLRRAAAKLPQDVMLRPVGPTDPLPFANAEFDAVISAAVVEHTVHPAFFVRELARVTKPGGIVVVSSDCYTWRVLQLLGAYKTAQPIDRAPLLWTLCRQFQSAGLSLQHCEGFSLPGQEYRFLRTAFGRPGRVAARALVRLKQEVALKLFGIKEGKLPRVPAFRLDPWRPQSFWRSLPLVLCSDENVFFLRKKA